jgi:hypothetical protein
MTDRSLMIMQKGSSLIYITSLVAACYLCSNLDKKAIFWVTILSILSTQKLLLLSFLIIYFHQKRIFGFMVLAIWSILSLGLVSIFREPELLNSIGKFASGTLGGHYESVLPLYKLIDSHSLNSNYPFFDVFINPFVDVYEKSLKFFEVFNQDYIGEPGILIAPSILGFFYYYQPNWVAPILTFAYIVFAIFVSRKIFIFLFGQKRYMFMEVAFSLLLLESSPDGMTFFLRIIFILIMVKILLYFSFYRLSNQTVVNPSVLLSRK